MYDFVVCTGAKIPLRYEIFVKKVYWSKLLSTCRKESNGKTKEVRYWLGRNVHVA